MIVEEMTPGLVRIWSDGTAHALYRFLVERIAATMTPPPEIRDPRALEVWRARRYLETEYMRTRAMDILTHYSKPGVRRPAHLSGQEGQWEMDDPFTNTAPSGPGLFNRR